MDKSKFMSLRKQGYGIRIVSYGEDVKAKIVPSYSADATFCGDKSYSGKVVKVKLVDYGETVKLAQGSSWSADFKTSC